MEDTPMTLGQRRVRSSFNPSKDNLVDQIKAKTAELIDLCWGSGKYDEEKYITEYEEGRLWVKAMDLYEEAAMWAVKAATAGK